MYGGPLRLLAWEIHERMNERGVACDLVTGQEVVRVPGAKHYSSTMEVCEGAGAAGGWADEWMKQAGEGETK